MNQLPQIMGVLNLTPDSFSDGGQFIDPEGAEERVRQMIADGAGIIDIGGQSTGPGSTDVTAEEELERVRPVIERLGAVGLLDPEHRFERPVFSIDTYHSTVARFALERGFGMVNDVTALRGDPAMTEVLADLQPWALLMYAKDDSPRTTTEAVQYDDVVASVKSFLVERAATLIEAGFPEDRIVLDPGMGMFVSAEPRYSFELIERLGELKSLGYPILVGVSRKSFLGGPLEERDPASVEWSLRALQNGASVVRMHNVKAMRDGLSRR